MNYSQQRCGGEKGSMMSEGSLSQEYPTFHKAPIEAYLQNRDISTSTALHKAKSSAYVK